MNRPDDEATWDEMLVDAMGDAGDPGSTSRWSTMALSGSDLPRATPSPMARITSAGNRTSMERLIYPEDSNGDPRWARNLPDLPPGPAYTEKIRELAAAVLDGVIYPGDRLQGCLDTLKVLRDRPDLATDLLTEPWNQEAPSVRMP